ncbi:SxtJ family membrane protein [Leucothrix arctica]|uniref:SxtJ n=1 Tax=Leucothrix arctica TaxID=1481894 RepID=A0A317CCF0_9GAMM|nr:SxtJ family membrane protein [Leucothrix arctica]PWQ96365.1 sxtJ [Leucothrix arctica]
MQTMSNKMDTVAAETPKALREFGLIMAGMLILMFGIVFPWLFSFTTPYWPFIAAFVFAVVALLKSTLLTPVNRIWLKLSGVLGWINTRLIMGLMFFFLIVPMGLVLRLLGKDPLSNELLKDAKSYRVISRVRSKEHLEKPF